MIQKIELCEIHRAALRKLYEKTEKGRTSVIALIRATNYYASARQSNRVAIIA